MEFVFHKHLMEFNELEHSIKDRTSKKYSLFDRKFKWSFRICIEIKRFWCIITIYGFNIYN